MAKTFLQRNESYYERIIREAENSPHAHHYQKVCTQLKKLVEITGKLRNPKHKMTPDEYENLTNSYKAVQTACEKYAIEKDNFDDFEKKRSGIVKDISSVVKKDMDVLLKCDHLNPGSLSEIMEKSRTHTIVLDKDSIKKAGGAQSSRWPIKTISGKKGFFTPKTVFNLDKEWEKGVEKYEQFFAGIGKDKVVEKLKLLKTDEKFQEEFSRYVPYEKVTTKNGRKENFGKLCRLATLLGVYPNDREASDNLLRENNFPFYSKLLGMAGGSVVIDHELGRKLWPLGLLTLFMGGYFMFDKRMDIINYSKDILFTNMQRLCMMFAAYEISFIVQEEINESRGKNIPPIVHWLSIFNIGLLLVTSFGDIMLYSTLAAWQIAQGIAFIVLLFIGIKTFLEQKTKKWNLLLSGIVMMCAILLEFINEYAYLWKPGILWKNIFLICLIHHLIEGVRTVPKNYRASKETERLKKELKNSRVVLAMSQIRTHFIFNVLNAISGMCLYDPAEANQTVVHFAKYLRGNINILQDDELIPFRKELEHLEDYIVLEKVRFEDKIQYVKEIEAEEFLIPPLILQPIVENAIKHGLLRNKKGGAIYLKTKHENDQIVIEITDDGAGFDVLAPVRDGAVGLSNVKFRLEYMIKGKMEITSENGKGTTVTIRMPHVVL